MSTESATERHRKRIVEHTVDGFSNAQSAIIFGNTIEQIIKDKIGAQKFNQQIGAPDTKLAITPEWKQETVLRATFLELADDAMAEFICHQFEKTLKIHNEVHRASLKTTKLVRGKPQPQFIGLGKPLHVR